jgi:urease accessory protein
MPDGGTMTTPHQRARGRADVVLGPGGVERLAQAGCAKAFLPRVHGVPPEAVFLNTAGGLTGGDRLEMALALGAGLRATAATQTAERAYAVSTGEAEVTVDLVVGARGRLDWLPQETILFDRSCLARRTRVDLAAEATVLMCEMVVLGRAAMGERLVDVTFSDRREVWRGDRPVLIEAVGMGPIALARGGGAAVLGGARAFATVALVGPGAEDAVAAARVALAGAGVEGAASAWATSGQDARCVVRLLAGDGLPLKRAVSRIILALGGHLPRVWQI